MAKSKMTTCKACGAEIAKSAKTCPQCGSKNKQKHPILGILLIIIGIAIIGAAFGGGSDEPKKVGEVEQSTTKQEQVQTEFKVGEKVALNDVVVTLVNVTESKGSQFNKPTDGNVFVLCEFEIENNTSGDVSVSSLLSFEAYCDDYTTNFSLTALMEKGNKNQLDGTVAAGKKFNGVVGYEIPKDWKELEIKFTPDFWSSKDITFIATH